MPYYLLQWAFKDPQIKALLEHPQDREPEARKVIEGCGGKLHNYFFAFGEYDGVAVCEFPDNESVTALGLTVAATGAFSRWETRVLMTSKEAQRAMEKAKAAKTGYKPPAG
jgi:uncharacterized protein with GYD domain